jgi:hypothetical protein
MSQVPAPRAVPKGKGTILAERTLMKKCTPAVERHWLLLIAGLLWSVVGIALCMVAGFWLSNLDWPMGWLGAAAGLAAGSLVYRYGFSRIAAKNIRRLLRKPDTLCLFAFQAWRSYILIAVMVVLGSTLRHSNLPRIILAFIYLSIGTGLTLSSSLYYEQIT